MILKDLKIWHEKFNAFPSAFSLGLLASEYLTSTALEHTFWRIPILIKTILTSEYPKI